MAITVRCSTLKSIRIDVALICCAAAAATVVSPAGYGHAFGQRYDLPLPFALYLIGAGAAVLLSFIVIALLLRTDTRAKRYPTLDLTRLRGLRWITKSGIVSIVRCASVGLYVLVLVSGFYGNESPFKNLAPTFVWVIWWVGIVFIVALIGNVWRLLNPWLVIIDWTERGYRHLTKRNLYVNLRLPANTGVWPAVILFLGFAWMELVWSHSDHPSSLATVIVIYSAFTWLGMILFGREQWLRRGEVFSVVFGLLSRFSLTEVRVVNTQVCQGCPPDIRPAIQEDCVNCYDGFARAGASVRQLNLRPWAVGLLIQKPIHVSMMIFTLMLLSTVSFDGILETPLWQGIVEWILSAPFLRSLLLSVRTIGVDLSTFIKSVALIVVPILFLMVYLFFCRLMSLAASRQSNTLVIARLFAFSLVPIALAYHFAHYLSYLLLAGQMIIPLSSDPLGLGWNLFGTNPYRLRIDVVSARMVWYTAVTAIVLGHIIAVYLAHVTALKWFKSPRVAFYSQIPMLVLMVGYTVISLWILSQPVVES